MKYIQKIIFVLLFITFQSYSQENYKITAGIGYGELLNIGVLYHLDQTELGLNFGTWPNEKVLSILTSIKMHFGIESNYSKIKPWYLLLGINYIYEDSRTKIFNYYYGVLRLGREFNISRKIGISIDLGIMGKISEKTIIKKELIGPLGGIDIFFLPNLSTSLYYRL